MPAAKPMNSAGNGLTNPEAGVIATSPGTHPEMAPKTLGLRPLAHSINTHPRAAAAAAKWVATKALVARLDARVEAEPAYPEQARTDETDDQVMRLHRFVRIAQALPTYNAVTSADTTEVMCTTVPPAKSKQGTFPPKAAFKKPPFAQTMWAIGKYTISAHKVMNNSMALNFIRSANAPEISAGVMMANIN